MTDATDPPSGPPHSGTRRRFLQSGVLLTALTLAPGSVGADGRGDSTADVGAIPDGPTIEVERVTGGLTAPITLEEPPGGGGTLYVVDQTGAIRLYDGNLRETPFLDVSDRMVSLNSSYDERGLLGFAVHPDFPADDRVFVRYSAPPTDDTPSGYDHTFVLSEFRTGDDPTTADPASERRLLEIPEPQANHNGGPITFGPDGYLYVAVGDGGDANDTGTGHVADWYDDSDGGNGQDVTENLLGSILRIDVDSGGDGGYAIPQNNPLVGREGLDEHFAWGFRNPWGLSFGPDGRLFAADAGQARMEEVDVVKKGGNYGWNVREGTDCFSPASPGNPPESCPDSTPGSVRGGEPLRDPIVEYPHQSGGQQVGLAVVGGYRSTSTGVDALNGAYVFGDWSRSYQNPSGRLFVAVRDDAGWSLRAVTVAGTDDGTLGEFLLGFGRDRSGRIYALTTENTGPTGSTGKVYRLGTSGGDGDDDQDPTDDPVETLTFEGRVSGWTGTGPVGIEGVENPTLDLVSGMTYEVVWENADGITHDFQIRDESGSILDETPDVSQQGETASTKFVATEAMTTYICSYHPTTQRGSITVRTEPKSVLEAVAGPDGTIGTPELRAAISMWARGDEVPETGGRTLTTERLRSVIQFWATGNPVGE